MPKTIEELNLPDTLLIVPQVKRRMKTLSLLKDTDFGGRYGCLRELLSDVLAPQTAR